MKLLILCGVGIAWIAAAQLISAQSVDSGTQARDALVGTWELNVSKSKVDPGPLPKKETRTYQPIGKNGVILSLDGIGGNGQAYAYGFTAYFDGKDYPMMGTGTRNGGDRLSYAPINEDSVAASVKKGTQVVNSTRLEVSKDRKVLTITETGTNQNGQKTNGVRVYDKVPAAR